MKWKLTHKHEHDIIENEGGKTLSYHPNLGIQIIEKDGFAFKDLNQSGTLEPFEDWRLPLNERIRDFTNRFVLWQEHDQLYYRKGRVTIPQDIYTQLCSYSEYVNAAYGTEMAKEEQEYLKQNDLLAVLLLMFDNDHAAGKEDYLLQLIVQSMDLGVLENIMYSIWEAIQRYLSSKTSARLSTQPI